MSSPCGRFFLHAVIRFLTESGTGDDVFLVGDACDELKGVKPQSSLKVVPRGPKLEGED